jgi:multidrug efflux pump subunit AcrB
MGAICAGLKTLEDATTLLRRILVALSAPSAKQIRSGARRGYSFEWTELALQEKLAGNTSIIAFGLAVVFVFLLLAALYESWLLPLAVVLIVPTCILGAMVGVNMRGFDRNIDSRCILNIFVTSLIRSAPVSRIAESTLRTRSDSTGGRGASA